MRRSATKNLRGRWRGLGWLGVVFSGVIIFCAAPGVAGAGDLMVDVSAGETSATAEVDPAVASVSESAEASGATAETEEPAEPVASPTEASGATTTEAPAEPVAEGSGATTETEAPAEPVAEGSGATTETEAPAEPVAEGSGATTETEAPVEPVSESANPASQTTAPAIEASDMSPTPVETTEPAANQPVGEVAFPNPGSLENGTIVELDGSDGFAPSSTIWTDFDKTTPLNLTSTGASPEQTVDANGRGPDASPQSDRKSKSQPLQPLPKPTPTSSGGGVSGSSGAGAAAGTFAVLVMLFALALPPSAWVLRLTRESPRTFALIADLQRPG